MFLFFVVSTKLPGVWWTEGVGFEIFSIASSSLGGRKKGYPKRQALWELTLALGRFPFDFVVYFCFLCLLCFSSILIDFDARLLGGTWARFHLSARPLGGT